MVKQYKPEKKDRNPNTLHPDDIRHFIWDRSVEDNSIELDLSFSDEEIHNAFRHMALSFNAIEPFVVSISADATPYNMWAIHGTIYHLLLSKYHKETRNDLTYEAGGITTDVQKTLIKHLQEQIKVHKEEFYRLAKAEKINININEAFRPGIG